MRSVLATVFVIVAIASCSVTGIGYSSERFAGSDGPEAQEPPAVAPGAFPPPFEAWLADLRTEAVARGISDTVVEQALGNLLPVPQVLQRDQTQAEFVLDLDTYLKRRLTRPTIRTARQMYAQHRTLLHKVAKTYGVDDRIVVAIWGLESNFGRFSGVRPTIATLATLAYDPRRGSLFRTELFNALEIVDNGHIELEQLTGSWAGAIGQPQFMPSSYLKYAQDFDEDGKRDIWTSKPDVFASIAFYLQQNGWKSGQIWGREVRVPKGALEKIEALPQREEGCRSERLMTTALPLREWRAFGLKTSSGTALPAAAVDASLVTAGTRHYLVYDNYEALLEYNCAHSYALSIGLLANQIR
jgi:membrane-bound lytic murein transglycosylase B